MLFTYLQSQVAIEHAHLPLDKLQKMGGFCEQSLFACSKSTPSTEVTGQVESYLDKCIEWFQKALKHFAKQDMTPPWHLPVGLRHGATVAG